MKELEILMMDGCTKLEAEKHLKNGTIIFEDLEEKIADYLKEWESDEEFNESVKKMIETKKPMKDWGIVEEDGKRYYIEYVL